VYTCERTRIWYLSSSLVRGPDLSNVSPSFGTDHILPPENYCEHSVSLLLHKGRRPHPIWRSGLSFACPSQFNISTTCLYLCRGVLVSLRIQSLSRTSKHEVSRISLKIPMFYVRSTSVISLKSEISAEFLGPSRRDICC